MEGTRMTAASPEKPATQPSPLTGLTLDELGILHAGMHQLMQTPEGEQPGWSPERQAVHDKVRQAMNLKMFFTG